MPVVGRRGTDCETRKCVQRSWVCASVVPRAQLGPQHQLVAGGMLVKTVTLTERKISCLLACNVAKKITFNG